MSDSRRRFDTKDLVERIERITKERMAREKVVSLKEFRGPREEAEPYHLLLIEDDETVRAALKRLFESEVPELYLCGTVLAGVRTEKVFIENGRDHAKAIAKEISGRMVKV